MPNDFFLLTKENQSEILVAASYQLGILPTILEKDLWVCWVLQQLFSLQLPLVFKGGTSLSKIFGLIQRFSEDIDITLDYRGFKTLGQPLENYSKSFLKKFSEELKVYVRECVQQIILPHFEQATKNISESIELEVSENGEQFRIHYPSALVSQNQYLADSVLIEFGGRNSIEPNEMHTVRSYLAEVTKDLLLPEANIRALSPLRTFWEKVTLIHVECQRGRLGEQTNRLSRHWYDLAMLIKSPIGARALADTKLAQDVIKYKRAFFYASYANYERCLNGQCQLVPSGNELHALEKDFRAMISAGMFYGTQPIFSEIIAKLYELECELNKK